MNKLLLFTMAVALFFSARPSTATTIKDCEKALAATSRSIKIGGVSVALDSNQVLYRGTLFNRQNPERRIQDFWMVADSFLSREVTPDPIQNSRQLLNGDRIFFLDDNGGILFSGFFGETNFQPTLYRNPDLTDVLIRTPKLRKLFQENVNVAAVVRLNDVERAMLDIMKESWFPLYRSHQRSRYRRVTVGTTTLPRYHFEEIFYGSVRARLTRAPNYRLEFEFIASDNHPIFIQPGDRLFLLDGTGNPLEEKVLGSRDNPISGSRDRLLPLARELSMPKAAVLFRNPVIRD